MFDKYVSIGSWCAVAQQLRGRNLRTESYPFDWLFGNIQAVLKSITEHNFVQKEYDRRAHNASDMTLFPAEGSHDHLQFPHHIGAEGSAKLGRACARWSSLLQSKHKVLFIHVPRPHVSRAFTLQQLQILTETLAFYYPRLQFKIAVLAHLDWNRAENSLAEANLLLSEHDWQVYERTNRLEIVHESTYVDYIVAHVSHEWKGDNWDGRAQGGLWEEFLERYT